jgi:hypothetical protein
MPKWLPKVIVDAERHRRTPKTPARGSKAVESEKLADIGDTFAEKGRKSMPKASNYTKMAPKIDLKTMKNRGGIQNAFLERFGRVFAANPLIHFSSFW